MLVFQPLFDAAAWQPTAGELVAVTPVGHTYMARVEAVDPERGVLVRWMPGQGFGAGDGMYVDAAKCRPAR